MEANAQDSRTLWLRLLSCVMFYAVIAMRTRGTIPTAMLAACVILLTACSAFSPAPRFEALHEFTGTADTATELFWLQSGAAVASFEHHGNGNFIVWLEDETADEIGLLANGIGEISGSSSEHIDAAGWYMLDIDADGPWSIRVEQLDL